MRNLSGPKVQNFLKSNIEKTPFLDLALIDREKGMVTELLHSKGLTPGVYMFLADQWKTCPLEIIKIIGIKNVFNLNFKISLSHD